MKKLAKIFVALLLMLLALVLLGPAGMPEAAARVYCKVTIKAVGGRIQDNNILFDAVGGGLLPRCYHFNVPHNTDYFQIELNPIGNGSFDVYHTEGQVTLLSGGHKLGKEETAGKKVGKKYGIPQPGPGMHTIGVSRASGSGKFRLIVKAFSRATYAYKSSTTSSANGLSRPIQTLRPTGAGGPIELGSGYLDQIIFPIEINGPGRVEALATWSEGPDKLALVLEGPDGMDLPKPVDYYARTVGGSPLSLAYHITDDDFRRGRRWSVSVVNLSDGEATVEVTIRYPGPATRDYLDAGARLQDFVGRWHNVDANTGGITKIEIGQAGNSLRVHSWGSCQPHDCDHGTTSVPFQGNPVVLTWDFSFKQETLTLSLLRSGELLVLSDNMFTDGSNRDYVGEYHFRRLSLELDMDRPGQDYRQFTLSEARPEPCQAACAADPRCQAYTFVKPGVDGPAALCYLKYGIPAPTTNRDCVSGVVMTLRQPNKEENVDRPGWDYKAFDLSKADPELCRAECAADPKCQAYTYVRPGVKGPQARCFLKFEVPPPVPNSCCISGVATAIRGMENVVYQENFDDGQAQGWTLDEGWRTSKGGLVGQGHKWAKYTAGEWYDSRVQFSVGIWEESGIHLNYRVSGQGRYYIGFRENVLYLKKEIPWGTRTGNLAISTVPHRAHAWHRVEIVGEGPHIQVSVGGVIELDYTDPDPLLSGTIAFETLEGSTAAVDNVVVIGP